MTADAIGKGRLLIADKIAELSPAATKTEAAKQGGRGKKKASSAPEPALAKETIAKYRKVRKHKAKRLGLSVSGYIRMATTRRLEEDEADDPGLRKGKR